VRLVLDACVLYPPVLRRILFGLAEAGLFAPLWSDRILGEWARATAKLGPAAEAQAQADAVLARAAFPRAAVPPAPGIEARLVLPDPNDVHVLATAIAGGADAILTFNAADFPRHVLAAEGVARRDPDGFLWELWSHHPEAVARVLEQVRAEAERQSGRPQSLRTMLKRLRLNRLAKAAG
jgi:predicted nucleic acid-binding protein